MNEFIYIGPIPPPDMYCSRCDVQLMGQSDIIYAWLGHDVHAHLMAASKCCEQAIVDRPKAHSFNRVTTAGRIEHDY